MKLSLDEVRRLTGPNLLSNFSGAIIDVLIEGADTMQVVSAWQKHFEKCQQVLNWQSKHFYRVYNGGASMSISAPMDLLYSACDLAELAWDLCVDELQDTHIVDFSERVNALKTSISEEANPALIELLLEAKQHHVVCLADDDEISLGTGSTAQTWPIQQLPKASSLNWSQYQQIPLALVTGTNGKSTSVRLAAEIAKAAGITAGVTSTDFIKVGNTIIDKGDYSGPGGARMLLRDKRTEMAFLEVARGGLLRRGLPVSQANAALITNAASDHLGQYGINTVDDIARVKLMLAKAIDENSILVLNADDERLVKFVPEFFPNYANPRQDAPICWFSLQANNELIKNHISVGKPCVYVENDHLIYHHAGATIIAKVSDIPMTVNGAAVHNVQNALGVVGLCKALKLSNAAILQGLQHFGITAEDNPGRGNLYEIDGRTLIVDFAHNAHSVQAVMNMAANMADKLANKAAVHVMFSHAGDRSDKDITDVADAVYGLQPTTYILAELKDYLRGRQLNEISQLVESHLVDKGVPVQKIKRVAEPLEGVKYALSQAKRGDLLLLFVLSQRDKVQTYLRSLS